MVKTKEEKADYMREWRLKNKDRLKKIIPDQQKKYNESYNGIKSMRISGWKRQGIIVKDWDIFYDLFVSTTECQVCSKILTSAKHNGCTHSTRTPHHDHNITDRPNIIAICCHACNMEDTKTTIPGLLNIIYYKQTNKWLFKKKIRGTCFQSPYFKTKQEAIDYKIQFLSNLELD